MTTATVSAAPTDFGQDLPRVKAGFTGALRRFLDLYTAFPESVIEAPLHEPFLAFPPDASSLGQVR